MSNSTVNYSQKIVEIMNLIYQKNLTTISGGNLSILDDNGDIWITPSGVDKGNLQVEDIVRVAKDGSISGRHPPSIELPFHVQIYQSRADIRAIIHAHPPALIATSLVHKTPPIRISPIFMLNCQKIDIAKYALPGSRLLGENIAQRFAEGCSAVILENHGVVVGEQSLDQAYEQFELLNFCASISIHGSPLGPLQELDDTQCAAFSELIQPHNWGQTSQNHLAQRKALCAIAQRIYQKGLSPSGFFSISQKLDNGAILISSPTKGLRFLTENDFFEMPPTMVERSIAGIHQAIYQQHPEVRTMITAMPPHAMGFACTGEIFDSRLIPESYMVMRKVRIVEYNALFNHGLSAAIDKRSDVLLVKNAMVVICAESPLKAYDRLEVLEFSAKAENYARAIGDIVHIADHDIEDIHQTFNL